MMANRLTIVLDQPEYTGLLKLAITELRDPPDQLRFLLRAELARRGLLPSVDVPQATNKSTNALNARRGTEAEER